MDNNSYSCCLETKENNVLNMMTFVELQDTLVICYLIPIGLPYFVLSPLTHTLVKGTIEIQNNILMKVIQDLRKAIL